MLSRTGHLPMGGRIFIAAKHLCFVVPDTFSQPEMYTPMTYYVYIMSNQAHMIYVGVTNNLERRVYEHKQKLGGTFTSKYNITCLVYFEETSDVLAAITREKQLKGWRRARKLALITAINPQWQDLSADWL